ncbi:MAG: hypothetical protein ABEJ73_03075 [Haloplanus sp.]
MARPESTPRSTLERLVRPPPRVRERTLDGAVRRGARWSASHPDTVDVACWTPLGSRPRPGEGEGKPDPSAALLADPSTPGDATDTIAHTLVMEVEEPVRSVRVDYGSLDAAVETTHGTRVRTDDGRAVGGVEAREDDDGRLVVSFADPPTDGALFVEYGVTRNPRGGRHVVDVIVNGDRHAEASLVVLG